MRPAWPRNRWFSLDELARRCSGRAERSRRYIIAVSSQKGCLLIHRTDVFADSSICELSVALRAEALKPAFLLRGLSTDL
jgi:hypothetical protein